MSDEKTPENGYAVPSGDIEHTAELRSRDWWVNWVLAVPFDGDEPDFDATATKQPVAPYDHGHARPVRWHAGLDDDEHPSTSFAEVVEWDGLDVGTDIQASERVLSDELGIGVIIPVGGGDGEPITLLDWDDVRDPETDSIHPVCAEALDECGGFAEISQSGEGIHQFVFGEIPGGLKKFLRHIDDEPFVGDSLPMLEMYSSGRLTAMTGDHVAGMDDDIVDGQDLIDDLCWEFGTADNNSPGTPTDPYNRRDDVDERDTPSHDAVGDSLREAVAYEGPDPAEWDIPDDEPFEYHAVLRAREREPEMVNTANWELFGYAAAIAADAGIPKEQLLEDLRAHDRPGYEFDESKARKEMRGVWRKAQAGNYEPPSLSTLRERGIVPDDGGTAAYIEGEREARDDDDESDDSNPWSYVRALYQSDEDDAKLQGRQRAADALESETSFMYVLESEILWVYDPERGYHMPKGESYIQSVLEDRLGSYYTIGEKNEITDRIRARSQVDRVELNARDAADPLLCVGNGVVNFRTGELLDHSAQYNFTRGLEWDYDPDSATPEPIVEFLESITRREEDWKTIVDHLAHGLMPGHPYRAFVMMYGPGGNGKTQLGELLRGFVGGENAAAVELQDLTGDDEFASGALPSAFVNIGDDVSVGEIRNTSVLKTVTGGGTLRANEKHEKRYDFKNEAAMFFSANEPPRIAEDKQSIDDRLYPIEMPFRFVDNPDPENDYERAKVPGIADDLLENEAAMEGLLALAVEHGQRLIETNGQYAMPEGPAGRRERYEAASDPILRFVVDYLEDSTVDDMVLKGDAYSVYTTMCDRDDERPAAEDAFKRKLSQQTTVDVENAQTRQLTAGDSRDRCWKYVRFTDAAKSLMSERLTERYFPGHEQADVDDVEADGDDAGGESASGDDDERAAFGAEPIMSAAESLTGYVTVTAEIVTTVRLGETNTGCKAVLKDASGAMDLVSWDSAISERLEGYEGEAVAVRNAEVSEYDGDHQLSVVDGLTSIESIQRGVGFTEAPAPDEEFADDGTAQGGLDETSAADSSTDTSEYEGAKARVVDYLRTKDDSATVPELAGSLNADPTAVRDAVEKLQTDGRVVERGSAIALND